MIKFSYISKKFLKDKYEYKYIYTKLILSFLMFLFSCTFQPSTKSNYNNDINLYSDQNIIKDEQSNEVIAGQEIKKDLVPSSEINSYDFMLKNIQINKQVLHGDEIPVISYIKPLLDKSDYVEIMRCSNTLNLVSSQGKSLSDLLALTAIDQVQMQMISTDFWSNALNSKRCIMVAYSYDAHSLVVDFTAKTGKFYYIARACVFAENILDLASLGVNNCSRMVTKSSAIDYKKNKDQPVLDSLNEQYSLIADYQSNVHMLNNLAHQTFNELEKCNIAEADRQIAVRKKMAINKLVSSGLSLMCALPSGVPAKKLFNSKFLGKANAAFSNADYCQNTIFKMLDGFSSSVDDYPKTCTEGHRLYRQAIALAEKIRSDSIKLRAINLSSRN